MDNLEQLVLRVEAARGPDRELDAEIALATNPLCHGAHHDPNNDGWLRKDGWGFGCWKSPEFTASLDAAVTLLTNYGVLIVLSEIKGDGMPLCVVGDAETSALYEAVANTMPLALSAAALRARAQKEGK